MDGWIDQEIDEWMNIDVGVDGQTVSCLYGVDGQIQDGVDGQTELIACMDG